MGAGSSNSGNQELVIGTLNYSGLISSPYEFFEAEDSDEAVSRNIILMMLNDIEFYQEKLDGANQFDQFKGYLLKKLIEYKKNFADGFTKEDKEYFNSQFSKGFTIEQINNFKLPIQEGQDQEEIRKRQQYLILHMKVNFHISTLDKFYQKRYCPAYNLSVGIRMNRFMETKAEFFESWYRQFEKDRDWFVQEFQRTAINYRQTELRSAKSQDEKIKYQSMSNDEICQMFITKKIGFLQKEQEILKNNRKKNKEFDKVYINNPSNKKWIETLDLLTYQINIYDYLLYKTLLYEFYFYDPRQSVKLGSYQNLPRHGENNQGQEKHVIFAQKYITGKKKMFDRSYLHEGKKINKVKKILSSLNLDILMLQEANNQLLEEIQRSFREIRVVKPTGESKKKSFSALLIRETKFNVKSLSMENARLFNNIIKIDQRTKKAKTIKMEHLKKLNINNDTIIQVIGNYIIVCSHLASKKSDNKKNIKDLAEGLNRLKKWFPEVYIIAGGDLNGNFSQQDLQMNQQEQNLFNNEYPEVADQYKKWVSERAGKNDDSQMAQSQQNSREQMSIQKKQGQTDLFKVFPNIKDKKPDKITCQTTFKRRSYMQTQSIKSNDMVLATKDYLITRGLEVLETCILETTKDGFKNIEGQLKNKTTNLPTDEHPFDHFIVTVKVKFEKVELINDESYLDKYQPKKLTKNYLQQIHGEKLKQK